MELARRLAGSLAGKAVRWREVPQLFPELAEEIAARDVAGVLFCDARPQSGGDGEAVCIARIAAESSGGAPLGHQLAPEVLLAIAEKLYDASPPAWLVTIEGDDFGHGEGLSYRVNESLEAAVERIRSLGFQFTETPATVPRA